MLHPSIIDIHHGMDAFGNRTVYGGTIQSHNCLAYISSGVVELEEYRITADKAEPIYLCNTAKTSVCEEMTEGIGVLPESVVDKALSLSHYVFDNMVYSPSSTDIQTTACEAFQKHQGVCQDYTHIFIALCRHYGIPARYVNGFIAGEGETHAWAEIYDGEAWIGIDPTHDCRIFIGYIKIAHGRDADDCPVSRGCYVGCASQQTKINVIVNEL